MPVDQVPVVQQEERPWALDLSVGGGMSFASAEVRAREHIGSPGTVLLGVGGTLHRFVRAQLGVGFAFAEDDAQVTQTVCAFSDMSCSSVDSHVWGAMLWGEIGPQYEIQFPAEGSTATKKRSLGIAGSLSLGYRGLWLTRQVAGANCAGCYQGELNITGGPYISPAFTYYPWITPRPKSPQLSCVGIRIKYEHFISGDLSSALAGELLFEF
jgi:hypothetical protein